MSVYAVIRANCFDNTKTKLKSLVMYVKYNVYVRIMYYEYLVVCSIEYANGNSKTFNQLTTIRFKLDQFNYSSLLGRSDPNIFVESLITIITILVPSMAKLKLVQFVFFFFAFPSSQTWYVFSLRFRIFLPMPLPKTLVACLFCR